MQLKVLAVRHKTHSLHGTSAKHLGVPRLAWLLTMSRLPAMMNDRVGNPSTEYICSANHYRACVS